MSAMDSLIKILLFSLLSRVNCSLTTQYYENLIEQKFSEAENYELPQRNEEFKTGDEAEEVKDFGSYDFIIVGAGSAGSVLATRLSEVREWDILLLEAGDEENDYSNIPALFFFQLFSEKNWGYLTSSQRNSCLGMKNKQCLLPRGKSIGGTSAINGVLNARGNPKDYDKIFELGNPGWSYKNVLPYFIKSENCQIDDGDLDYHETGGFWNLENALPPSDLSKILYDASAELNHTYVDYNGKTQIGMSRTQINTKHGKRQSTGTAFLDNARRRSNLKVVTKALVTKIKIESNVAKGVEFVTNNTKYKVTTKREIFICGGAINSPQLLMLSGIGPKKHLQELGIDVVQDLPVGQNLKDHPLFLGLNFHTNYEYVYDESLKPSIEKYLNGFGPLAKPGNIEATGFMAKTNGPSDVPMTEHMFIPPGSILANVSARIYNFNDKLVDHYLLKLNPKSNIGFLLLLLHEKSSGSVTLKSKSPIDFPNVDLNFYSDPEDIDNIIEGIEFLMRLTQTKAFQQLNATMVDIPLCEKHVKYSKPFWICALRHMTMSGFHLTGTTQMGPNTSTAVVDHNLKVHGIDGLRVIDAGVFPVTLSGPTNAPTVMMAEKISDVIKCEYNIGKSCNSD